MASPACITPLNLGYLQAGLLDWYRLPRGHPARGQVVRPPMQAFHVNLGERSVVVDAPVYDETVTEAGLALPGPYPPPLAEQLAAIGANVDTVTDVIITHSHFDHINGLTLRVNGDRVPLFPRARHYLGAGDWTPADFDELQQNTLGVLDQQGLLQLVHGPLDLGDGLDIVPAPGETPGHQLLHLHTDGLETFFTGDLYHHPLEFAEPALNVLWAEPVSMRASKAALMARAEASGASVYVAHIEGAWSIKNSQWQKIAGAN